MNNPFYVHPGNDIGPSLMGLSQILEAKSEQRLAQAEEKKKLASRQEASRILANGDADEISQFVLANPWVAEDVSKAIGFKNDITKANALESARRILMGGEPPSKVLTERAEMVLKEGGDPSGTMKLAFAAHKDPESVKKEAEKILAIYDHEAFKAYKETLPESEKRTAKIQEFEKYAAMPDGPEKEAFGRVIGADLKPVTVSGDSADMKKFSEWASMPDGPGKSAFGQMIGVVPKEQDVGLDPLTPEGLELAAQRYAIDGTLPPLGMGKAAGSVRTQIINRAANIGQENKMTPEEMRLFQIGTSVNKTALSQLMKQKTMVGAFERNFVKNADLALNLSEQFDRTGTPLLNKWVNVGKRAITGDPKLSKLDQAIKSVVNEYSKIISGSMGNTAIAEGEIKKVESMLNAAQNAEQVKAVIDLMKQETQNRMKGFEEQESELREGMKLPTSRREVTQPAPISVDENDNITRIPPGVTEEDIAFTAQKYGISREEVLSKLGGK